MKKLSDHYNGKIFLNPVPTEVMKKGSFFKVLKKMFQKHPGREPSGTLGPFSIDEEINRSNPSIEPAIIWLGHSSLMIGMDGNRFLTDPVWSKMASPFIKIGPRRFFDNPLPLGDLPSIDFILLSHDHYDHLDKRSMLELTEKKIPVITMLGVGERLIKWGADPSLIKELDWWESYSFNGLNITATPARHFSGRWINDRFKTLWGAFAIKGPGANIYFGADSGYYEGFETIGGKLGPFDLCIMEVGAYNEEWEQIHMGPEAAVRACIDMGGALLMPVHWGTFNLAFHPWKEPIERLIKEAKIKSLPLLVPVPGQIAYPRNGEYISHWWEKYD